MKLMESRSSVPEKDVIVVQKAHITQSLFPLFCEVIHCMSEECKDIARERCDYLSLVSI